MKAGSLKFHSIVELKRWVNTKIDIWFTSANPHAYWTNLTHFYWLGTRQIRVRSSTEQVARLCVTSLSCVRTWSTNATTAIIVSQKIEHPFVEHANWNIWINFIYGSKRSSQGIPGHGDLQVAVRLSIMVGIHNTITTWAVRIIPPSKPKVWILFVRVAELCNDLWLQIKRFFTALCQMTITFFVVSCHRLKFSPITRGNENIILYCRRK